MAALLARYVVLAAAVMVLNFLLPRVLPGDPLDADEAGGLGPAAPVLTAGARERIRAYYHLDQPLTDQFVSYLGDLGRGDLGWSIGRSAPVAQLIKDRLPWTLGLVLTSLLLAGGAGVLLGLFAAWTGGRVDRAIAAGATVLAALPEFLVAMALLLALAVGLHLFPLQGGRSVFDPTPAGTIAGLGGAWDVAWHLTLPAATLLIASLAGFVLLTRGSTLGLLGQTYLIAARAKGLSGARIVLRHVAPNALLPVLTFFGVRVGHVLGGAVVVERVFSIPGLGLLSYEAIGSRDYPVLQAIFLLASLTVLAANLLVEIAYRRLGGGQLVASSLERGF